MTLEIEVGGTKVDKELAYNQDQTNAEVATVPQQFRN